jgi:hypothetical protein
MQKQVTAGAAARRPQATPENALGVQPHPILPAVGAHLIRLKLSKQRVLWALSSCRFPMLTHVCGSCVTSLQRLFACSAAGQQCGQVPG